MSEGHRTVYLVRAGRNGEDEAYALDHGVAIIGFKDYPSLKGVENYKHVVERVRAARPDLRPKTVGNFSGQLWAFALAMQEDDIVVLPRKLTSQVAIGRVTGAYKYEAVDGVMRHVRPVEWVRPDVSRSEFGQDLLRSFGALMTVCKISRNDVQARLAAVLSGQPDPGFRPSLDPIDVPPVDDPAEDDEADIDLTSAANDQVVAHIQKRFHGHDLARLVNAVLVADGWSTKLSPPGPDGGIDIFAGRGPFGLDAPRLCVQVKSQISPADVTVFRTLQGAMLSYKAEQGLLVCWGGFNKAVLNEAKQGYFTVRLWESRDLVDAIYRLYEKLPAEIQAELPLKQVWMLVNDGDDA